MKTTDYQSEAEKAVKEAAELRFSKDFSYHGEADLGQTWAMTFSQNRDSGLMEQSNYAAVKEDLEKRFPRDVSDERFNHFAVGWVDHLLVRMLDKNGKVTKAGIAALEWKDRLDDYPVADDEDLSRRELEATFDNIKFEGGLDEDTTQKVYDWLSEHEPRALENRDDKGGYPSSEQIETALKALGLMELEEGEEPPPPPRYVDPPEQRRFWES
jgi:hypothetical protein